MNQSCTPRRRTPRMTMWTVITLCLLAVLAFIRPEQLQVVLYKSFLVTLGAVMAYWLDRALFPNARPTECAEIVLVGVAMMRRALIVLAVIIGLTMGL